MPVFAEQKESTNLDRVVEPALDASSVRTKEEPNAYVDATSSALNNSKSEQQQQQSETEATTTEPESQTSSSSESETSSTSTSSVSSPSSGSVNAPTEGVSFPSLSSPSPAEETMIFFDWDDTLLASSFLSVHGYRLDTDMESKDDFDHIYNELRALETCVIAVLQEALPRGKVHIITNAEHGWVELSAQKFIPAVVPFLSKITVVSARSTYEHLFPECPVKWKLSAFQDRLQEVFLTNHTRKNIISLGDSHVEREAVRTVTRGVANTKTKSIKFTESPTMDQLRKQLELVTNNFQYIFTHDQDLDLMLKMSTVPAQ